MNVVSIRARINLRDEKQVVVLREKRSFVQNVLRNTKIRITMYRKSQVKQKIKFRFSILKLIIIF